MVCMITGLYMYVQKPKVPWLKMAKSLPVWAVCIAHFTNNWGYYTLLTCLPMYLKNILHFDMKSVSTTALSRFFSGVVFTARCYASAVLAMALCLSVCPSIRHKSEFY